MKKTVFTLDINNYAPEIKAVTFPLIRYWARKIGATFRIINERKFPDWPIPYEKMQIYELGKEMGNDWNIYVDADTIIHPETLDWTYYLNKNTVAHNGSDYALIRWRYDRYFWRDGRNIGSCNWMTIASDWCIDLWEPLDMTYDEAVQNVYPTVGELSSVIVPEHLLDDYTLSRNIAKYGLKFTTLKEVQKSNGFEDAAFFWHVYTVPVEEKIVQMKEVIKAWKIPQSIMEIE